MTKFGQLQRFSTYTALEKVRMVIVATFAVIGAVVAGTSADRITFTFINALRTIFKADELQGWKSPIVTTVALIFLGGIFGAFASNMAIDFLESARLKWDKMDSGDKVTYFLGFVLGLIVAISFSTLLNQAGGSLAAWVPPVVFIAMILGFSALTIYLMRSMDDTLPWQRQSRPGRRRGIKILDTNLFIDGRIYDVARAGFLDGTLYVPQYVLDELQYLADQSDPIRRQRGRRGLDVLRHLKSEFPVEIGTYDKLAPELGDPVDKRLVRLARACGGDIVTNDFNLNRVAELQEVKVLNLNDLALALRTNILPQERMPISVVREGSQSGQGIGYLEDGTMVVVEGGKPHLGETVSVIVTQVLQTERGKMVFAEIDEDAEDGQDHRDHRRANGNRRNS